MTTIPASQALSVIIFLSLSVATFAQEASWKPLTNGEIAAVRNALTSTEVKGHLTIACGGSWCKEISISLEGIFEQAGWKIKKIHHGGLGIDGVEGIRIDSCGVQEKLMHDVLAKLKSRKIEDVDEGVCTDS